MIRIITMLILPPLMKRQLSYALIFRPPQDNCWTREQPAPVSAWVADWFGICTKTGGAAFDLDLMNSDEQQSSCSCSTYQQLYRPSPNERTLSTCDANSWELHVNLRQKTYTNPNHPRSRLPSLCTYTRHHYRNLIYSSFSTLECLE